jgi:hypothetical protein
MWHRKLTFIVNPYLLTLISAHYNQVKLATHKVADFVEKSVRSAAEWNKEMNAEVREKRRAYFDMQTFQVEEQ